MRISRRLLLGQFLTGSGLGICRARAQDPVFSADSRAVTLMATVHNAAGRLIPDLNKEDFILTEEGRTVEIRYFSREADLPLTIGLMIDTSGLNPKIETAVFGTLCRERNCEWQSERLGDIPKHSGRWRSSG
jgi:hypothetical protein